MIIKAIMNIIKLRMKIDNVQSILTPFLSDITHAISTEQRRIKIEVNIQSSSFEKFEGNKIREI